MTFDEIYNQVERSSHETAFNREECQALWDLRLAVGSGAPMIVEIGVQYGRSLTILGYVAKELGGRVFGVDNWQELISEEAKAHVEKLIIGELGLPVDLINKPSLEAAKDFVQEINLLHIDGNHEYEAVKADILAWVPKVVRGGFICFDDYGHDSLPGPYDACQELLTPDKYRFVGRFGNKLGIYQKI